MTLAELEAYGEYVTLVRGPQVDLHTQNPVQAKALAGKMAQALLEEGREILRCRAGWERAEIAAARLPRKLTTPKHAARLRALASRLTEIRGYTVTTDETLEALGR